MRIRHKHLLIAILVVSVLLRLGAALYMGNQVNELPGTADQRSYHVLAQRVLGGFGFSFPTEWWPATKAGAPTAHWSYLYTGFLVTIYALFGPNPLAARLVQALIVGILHPLLAYALARHLYGRPVGLAAAAATAGYIYFFYYAGTLMTEPFYISAILASLLVAVRWVTPAYEDADSAPPLPAWLAGLALGLALAAAVLLRQLFLLIIPFLFAWIWWAGRRKRIAALPGLAIAAGVIIAAILPFTWFNSIRFERFVLLNTNAGFAFFWGNHPIHGTNFLSILPAGYPSYQTLIPPELRQLDEAAMDQALLKLGLQVVLDDPVRYVLLSLNRAKDYFEFWPAPDSGLVSNLSRVASFGLFLPFMVYGVWLAARKLSLRAWAWLASPAALLLGFGLLYTGVHLLTWTLIRYRLPVDAVLLVFASLALVDLARRIPALRGLLPQPSSLEKIGTGPG